MQATEVHPLWGDQVETTDDWGVRWRTLPGKPHFRVSELGALQRLDKRKSPTPRTERRGQRSGDWRWCRPSVKSGMICYDNSQTAGWAHRLVGHAFFGPLAPRRRIAFVDGNTLNARVGNLCLVVNKPRVWRRKGSKRKKKGGTRPSLAAASRFSDDKAQAMIDAWHACALASYEEAAAVFGVTKSAAESIILGVSRPHLDRPAGRRVYFRKYHIQDVLRLMWEWSAGKYPTKLDAAKAYGWPKEFVSRVLNGKYSERLPKPKDPEGYNPKLLGRGAPTADDTAKHRGSR